MLVLHSVPGIWPLVLGSASSFSGQIGMGLWLVGRELVLAGKALHSGLVDRIQETVAG